MALKKKNSECRSLKSTTSNLRGHLSNNHPSVFEDLEKLENNVPITVAKKRKLDFSSSTQPNLKSAVKSVEKYKQNSNLRFFLIRTRDNS